MGKKIINKRVFFYSVLILLLLLTLNGCDHGHNHNVINPPEIHGKYILMIIAPNNFRDEEFFIPVEEFKSHGFDVIVASSQNKAYSVKQKEVTVNVNLEDALSLVDNSSAVVFSGGPGVSVYFKNSLVKNIVLKANNTHKVIGAICLAPVILANSGILKGRNATVWDDSFTNLLIMNGAHYLNKSVVIDGNIVTSNGPEHAKKFADAVLNLINKKEGDSNGN